MAPEVNLVSFSKKISSSVTKITYRMLHRESVVKLNRGYLDPW